MNNNTQYLAIIFALLFSIGFAHAQTAFTGSDSKLDVAVKNADAIFTGQVEEIGAPVFKALGEKSYYGIRIKVVQVLKGTVDSEVLVSLIARMDTKVVEAPPESGKTYLFFAKKKKNSSQLRVIKLIVANNPSIAEVKQLISQSPQ